MNAVMHKPLDEHELIIKISSVLAEQVGWSHI
jgi:hypothetical protein